MNWLWKNRVNTLKIVLLVVIVLWTSFEKYKVFDESGGDFEAYRNASIDLLKGVNPYRFTVKSFTQEVDQWGEEMRHGYAYLPGLMYIQAPIYHLYNNFDFLNLPLQRLWRVPLLVADIGVAFLIGFYLFRKNYSATVVGVFAWAYHPFFASIGSYTNWEPFSVLLLLLALMFLEERDDWAAILFSLAVGFKTFPIILFPLFLIKSKNRLRFLMIGALTYFVLSIPFMYGWKEFWIYVQGSLLVHGNRELQGRPLLSYLTFYIPLNFMQVSLTKFYAYASILLAWLVPLWLNFKGKLKNKYILALISFGIYYIFTPVLNRTHLIWGIPFLILGVFEITKRRPWIYYLVMLGFYGFYFWYLSQWTRGFRFEGDIISL